jgi:hypothetical protein
MPGARAFAPLLERGEQMKRTAILLLGVAACSRQVDHKSAQQPTSKPLALPTMPAAQSPMPGKAAAEMKLIPIPKDKAQLARLVAMGYTVHQNHMHPPGVKSCPFDKNAGSVIE